jgi:glyoxylase-like metal-dependent hydrolase (beta-lactamase superfamily II)
MTLHARKIGDATVTQVVEYSAPTHQREFLFPDLSQEELNANADWLGPHHYVPHMNRLIITIQLWVIHAGGNVIVVDTGVGNFKRRKAARMNMLNSLVVPWLEAAGAAPADVTHVVQTHVHSDHVGWNTTLVDGQWAPTFPNARYCIPKKDFDYFDDQVKRGGGHPLIEESFADSVYPVIEAGLVDFITDDMREVAGVLSVEPAPGHCPGMVTYRLRSSGQEGLFTGDVMHSPVQIVKPSLNTSYCLEPDLARKTRLEVLNRAADRDALIMPMHFGAPYCGYVRRQGDGFRFEPAA